MRVSPALLALGVLVLSAAISFFWHGQAQRAQGDTPPPDWRLPEPAAASSAAQHLQRLQAGGFLGDDTTTGRPAAAARPSVRRSATSQTWNLLGTVSDAAGQRAIIETNGEVRQLAPGEAIDEGVSLVAVAEDSIIVQQDDEQRTLRLFDGS